MSTMPEKEQKPSTYFVQDRSNGEEVTRLQLQDQMLTVGMGGVLPEQPEPIAFRQLARFTPGHACRVAARCAGGPRPLGRPARNGYIINTGTCPLRHMGRTNRCDHVRRGKGTPGYPGISGKESALARLCSAATRRALNYCAGIRLCLFRVKSREPHRRADRASA